MRKRQISILSVGLSLLFALSGCSSAKTGSSSSTSSATNSGPVTLTIMSSEQTSQEGPDEKAMATKYMKEHPNVTINFVGVANNSINQKIIAENSSNDLPDAFYMNSEFMAQADSIGIVADCKKIVGNGFLTSLSNGVVDAASINGHMVMVPWQMIPMALIYRSDWLKEAGLTSLETWDDFLKAAQAFTKDTNGDGKIDRWGFSMVGSRDSSGENRFMAIAATFGVDAAVKDKSGKWTSALTGKQFIQALTYFTDLANKYGVVPAGATQTNYSQAANYFAQEKTGLMISGSNAIGAILSSNPNLKGKLASVALPKETRHSTVLQVAGYAITNSCKNKAVLADYLKSMTTDDNAIPFAQTWGRLPVTKSASTNEAFKDQPYSGFIDAAKYAYKLSAFPQYTQLIDIAGEAYTNTIGNKMSVTDAMKTVSQKTKTLIDDTNAGED